ncbi:hypothetical protein ROZALSC1DRAFT_27306 [Rozella allomycis CSF55]|uniref:Uncharacterized protein n=1 Tax=Rozella allomycis (strain CSF55) TaxID=988480 RepID=A0A075B3E7_ROZAC|nr:hypothetical protein O9G_005036 [Rozella allomycis CSF55]RKP21270.1 hypothetical protein ROZALSC1DRAFT_27306 [Rozella allomycis CSF55]|eukprot:EPZ37070.1 hypothetical protein O9G_005036 [Rozella allomycis CSF55]
MNSKLYQFTRSRALSFRLFSTNLYLESDAELSYKCAKFRDSKSAISLFQSIQSTRPLSLNATILNNLLGAAIHATTEKVWSMVLSPPSEEHVMAMTSKLDGEDLAGLEMIKSFLSKGCCWSSEIVGKSLFMSLINSTCDNISEHIGKLINRVTSSFDEEVCMESFVVALKFVLDSQHQFPSKQECAKLFYEKIKELNNATLNKEIDNVMLAHFIKQKAFQSGFGLLTSLVCNNQIPHKTLISMVYENINNDKESLRKVININKQIEELDPLAAVDLNSIYLSYFNNHIKKRKNLTEAAEICIDEGKINPLLLAGTLMDPCLLNKVEDTKIKMLITALDKKNFVLHPFVIENVTRSLANSFNQQFNLTFVEEYLKKLSSLSDNNSNSNLLKLINILKDFKVKPKVQERIIVAYFQALSNLPNDVLLDYKMFLAYLSFVSKAFRKLNIEFYETVLSIMERNYVYPISAKNIAESMFTIYPNKYRYMFRNSKLFSLNTEEQRQSEDCCLEDSKNLCGVIYEITNSIN